jgi:4'-phosphopantetheinyl transferase
MIDDHIIRRLAHGLPASIEVFHVDLDRFPLESTAQTASPDELSRASRFASAIDRRRFLSARRALRSILAQVTGRPPESLQFEANRFGKPRLPGHEHLDFNISHSLGECLVATSTHKRVGVDIEVIQPVADVEALATRHLSARERSAWVAAIEPEKTRRFLTAWTRKEAGLKALGIGLSGRPSSFEAGCTENQSVVCFPLQTRNCEIVLGSVSPSSSSVAAVALAEPVDAQQAQDEAGGK